MPLMSVDHVVMINLIRKHVIHRLGLLEMMKVVYGTVFANQDILAFVEETNV